MKFRRFFLALFGVLVFAGCANTTKQHFETDPTAIRAGKSAAANPDRAVVYLMREYGWGQDSLPPLFYAVDGKMVSAMPLGSYVPLSLEPGPHTFTRFIVVTGGVLARFQVVRADVRLGLVAGQTYFVSEINAITPTFRQVDKNRGRDILDGAALAKFVHAPVRTSVFVSRLVEAERLRKAGPAPSQQSPSGAQNATSVAAGFQDLLPSSKQVGDALQAVASVAMVVLYIIALGASESANSHQAAAPVPFSAPPAISRPVMPVADSRSRDRVSAARQVEPLEEVERMKNERTVVNATTGMRNERTVVNATTGVKYLIDGDRVKGSDGSSYRAAGTMLFSDSGPSYQVIGNFVFASDGRSCVKIGDKLHCN